MRPTRPGRQARVSATALIVCILLGAGAGAGVYYLLGVIIPRPGSTESGGGPDRNGEITALGRLEPADGVLDIIGPTGDRILSLGDLDESSSQPSAEPPFKEGDPVTAGTVLVVLESWKDRKRELEHAKAQLKDAEDRRQAIAASGDKQIDVAKARVTQARQAQQTEPATLQGNIDHLGRSLALAQQQLDALQRTGSASRFQIEDRQLQVQRLDSELANARRQKPVAEESLKLNVAIAEANLALAESEKQRGMAEVPVETARSRLALAELAYERTKIKAPRDGRILKVHAQRGEVLTGRPILLLADTAQMVAVAEVYETSVAALRQRLASGQAVTAKVVSPALPGGYNRKDPRESAGALNGRVVSVGSQIARNRVFDVNPAADVDRRVVEVRVRLDDPAKAAGFINLQVTVYLDVK